MVWVTTDPLKLTVRAQSVMGEPLSFAVQFHSIWPMFGAYTPVTVSMVGTAAVVVEVVEAVVWVVVVVGGTVDDNDEEFVAKSSLPLGVNARSVTSPAKTRSLAGATHSLVVGAPANLTARMAFTGEPVLEFAPPR